MRQIILDTETTGLDISQGHRLIEIGALEMVNRRLTGNRFHSYLNPEREIEPGAAEVHGITTEMLLDKPRFRDLADDLLRFINGAELVIHNADFDIGFLNYEFGLVVDSSQAATSIQSIATVLDTLKLARQIHPGKKNDLNALCERYNINNTSRTLHGALLDAELLAEVYLSMTGGQTGLFDIPGTTVEVGLSTTTQNTTPRIDPNRPALLVLRANDDELAEHERMIDEIQKKSGGQCLWVKKT